MAYRVHGALVIEDATAHHEGAHEREDAEELLRCGEREREREVDGGGEGRGAGDERRHLSQARDVMLAARPGIYSGRRARTRTATGRRLDRCDGPWEGRRGGGSRRRGGWGRGLARVVYHEVLAAVEAGEVIRVLRGNETVVIEVLRRAVGGEGGVSGRAAVGGSTGAGATTGARVHVPSCARVANQTEVGEEGGGGCGENADGRAGRRRAQRTSVRSSRQRTGHRARPLTRRKAG